jgi:hypothetical protein
MFGEFGEQIGGVVRIHRLQYVRGALVGQFVEELDLVVGGQLLQYVGQPVVVERGGDLHAALRREVVDGVGDVRGAHTFEGGQQRGRALLALLQRETRHRRPLDGQGLAATPECAALPLP